MADPSGWKKYLYRFLFLGFLTGLGIYIWSLYLPFHAPELLPLPPANPASDGSYPELSIRYTPTDSGPTPFEVSFTRNSPSLAHDSPVNQFEVDLSSGKFVTRQTDLFEDGPMPISLTRTYDSFDSNAKSFGIGASQPYDVFPVGSRYPYTFIDLELEDGESVHFERISKGVGYTEAVYEHRATSSREFLGARIRWNGDGWDLSLPSGSIFVFPEAYSAKSFAQAAVTEIRSAAGQRVDINRSLNGDIKNVIASSGRRIDFFYDNSGRVIEARDNLGRDRKYSYDSDGRLVSSANANFILYQFAYIDTLMTRVMDGTGKEVLGIVYHGGRVAEAQLAGGDVYRFTYDIDSRNHVVRTDVLGPDGATREFRFN